MQLIRCRKCGAVIVSDETFLQTILDTIEETNRRAQRCHPSKRSLYLREAAGYQSMFKAFMHNLTQKQAAEYKHCYILSVMRKYLLDNNILSEEQIKALYDEGERKAELAKQRAEKEIRRVYGEYETARNRTMPSPTERAAMKHLK